MRHPSTRGERRAETERVVANRKRDWETFYTASKRGLVPLEGARLGTCREKHPFGCGAARCWLCHSEKLRGAPLPRDVRKLPVEPLNVRLAEAPCHICGAEQWQEHGPLCSAAG